MGSGVAEVAARAGCTVVLRSRTDTGANDMVAGLEKSLIKQVEKGKLDDGERIAILDRVRAVTDLGELAACDLVLESIVEDLDAKRHLFRELDRVCGEHTILATNTSTLPVVEMAMDTGRPDRVCGIHFFNPATLMPLVEVVRAITTSDATIAAARNFAAACGSAARPASASTTTTAGSPSGPAATPTPSSGEESRCERHAPHPRPPLGHADLLGPLLGAGVQRALPHEPRTGADGPLRGLRPAHPDRLRPRSPACAGRGRQGR